MRTESLLDQLSGMTCQSQERCWSSGVHVMIRSEQKRSLMVWSSKTCSPGPCWLSYLRGWAGGLQGTCEGSLRAPKMSWKTARGVGGRAGVLSPLGGWEGWRKLGRSRALPGAHLGGSEGPKKLFPPRSQEHCRDSHHADGSQVSLWVDLLPGHLKKGHLDKVPLAGLGCGVCLLPLRDEAACKHRASSRKILGLSLPPATSAAYPDSPCAAQASRVAPLPPRTAPFVRLCWWQGWGRPSALLPLAQLGVQPHSLRALLWHGPGQHSEISPRAGVGQSPAEPSAGFLRPRLASCHPPTERGLFPAPGHRGRRRTGSSRPGRSQTGLAGVVLGASVLWRGWLLPVGWTGAGGNGFEGSCVRSRGCSRGCSLPCSQRGCTFSGAVM